MRVNRSRSSLLPDGPMDSDYTKDGGQKDGFPWSFPGRFSKIRLGHKVRVLLQLLLVLYLMKSLYEKFSFTDNDDARFQHLRNHACLEDNQDLCVMPNQFNKFVWIFVDSLAHDHATELINTFGGNSNLHRIMNHGFKFSTAIYTTFFTGKIPTNYAGNEIHSDNLFYQFQKAGYKIQYGGPKFPTSTLLASDKYGYFSKEVFVPDEERLISFLQANIYSSYFDDAARKGASLMFTTNYLDEKIHRTGKKNPANHAMVKALQPIMVKLKEFIDKNPDYLLIMNSDHGGSLTGGKHEGQLHGAPDGGNEGWILFYNPTLTPLPERGTWLDSVDVCGTIAAYFSKVSIPTESVGIASASTDSIAHKWKLRKLNAMQIKKLADLKQFSYDEGEYEAAISETDMSVAVEKMGTFIRSIKDPLLDFKRFPSTELVVMGIMVAIYQIVLVFQEYGSLNEVILSLRTNPVAVILPFFFLYFDISFLKFDYFMTSFMGTFNTYAYVMGATFLLCVYQLSAHLKTGDSLPFTGQESSTKVFDSDLVLGSYSTTMALRRISLRILSLMGYWMFVSFYFNVMDGLLFMPFIHLLNFVGLELLLMYDCGITSYKELAERLPQPSHETLFSALIALVYVYEFLESLILMQFIYFVMLIYLVYALLRNGRVVVYPVVLLLFILSIDEERFFLIFVLMPSYHVMAEIFRELPNPYSNETKGFLYRNAQKMLLLLLIDYCYVAFVQMGGEFNMNVVVRAGAVGVLNVEHNPTLSAFLMAFHKLGYFFILAALWARLVVWDRKKLDDFFSNGGILSFLGTSMTESVWRFMVLKTLILMWTFHLAFFLYKDYLTCFIMTMITSLFTALVGGAILSYQSYEYFEFVAKFFVQKYHGLK